MNKEGVFQRTSAFHGELANMYSLALAVLQIKMRIEVDEDPLVRTRGRDHPHASLRRGIRHGVSGRSEVVGG